MQSFSFITTVDSIDILFIKFMFTNLLIFQPFLAPSKDKSCCACLCAQVLADLWRIKARCVADLREWMSWMEMALAITKKRQIEPKNVDFTTQGISISPNFAITKQLHTEMASNNLVYKQLLLMEICLNVMTQIYINMYTYIV